MSPRQEPTNCPFYGHSHAFTNIGPRLAWMLIPVKDNQCALADKLTPCEQETQGLLIDWSVCPVFGERVVGRSRLFKVKGKDEEVRNKNSD